MKESNAQTEISTNSKYFSRLSSVNDRGAVCLILRHDHSKALQRFSPSPRRLVQRFEELLSNKEIFQYRLAR